MKRWGSMAALFALLAGLNFGVAPTALAAVPLAATVCAGVNLGTPNYACLSAGADPARVAVGGRLPGDAATNLVGILSVDEYYDNHGDSRFSGHLRLAGEYRGRTIAGTFNCSGYNWYGVADATCEPAPSLTAGVEVQADVGPLPVFTTGYWEWAGDPIFRLEDGTTLSCAFDTVCTAA